MSRDLSDVVVALNGSESVIIGHADALAESARIIAEAESRAQAIVADARATADRELAAARAESARLIEAVATRLSNATRWDQSRVTLPGGEAAEGQASTLVAEPVAPDRLVSAPSPLVASPPAPELMAALAVASNLAPSEPAPGAPAPVSPAVGDALTADAGLVVAGPVDAGPVVAGPVVAGPVDAGPVVAGPVDAPLVDPASSDHVAAVPAASTPTTRATDSESAKPKKQAKAQPKAKEGRRGWLRRQPPPEYRPRLRLVGSEAAVPSATDDEPAVALVEPATEAPAVAALPAPEPAVTPELVVAAEPAVTPELVVAAEPAVTPELVVAAEPVAAAETVDSRETELETVPRSRRHHSAKARTARRWRGVWGRLIHRLRWAVLALGVVALVASAIWGLGVVERLTADRFKVPGVAAAPVPAVGGKAGSDVVALYRSGTMTVDDPRFQAAVADVMSRVPAAGPDGRGAASFWTTKDPAFVSGDRRSTYVTVQLAGSAEDKEAFFRDRLASDLTIDPAVATTRFGGAAPLGAELGDTEAGSTEGVAVPDARVAEKQVAAQLAPTAVLVVLLLGLILAIEYTLLIGYAFGAEVRAGRDTRAALSRTMSSAGRSVLVSAAIVAISLTGLLFVPVPFLRSTAIGGLVAVAGAAVSALTVLPALLAVIGPRMCARAATRATREAGRHAGRRQGGRERFARAVMARPLRIGAAGLVGLVLLSVPLLGVRPDVVGDAQLPASSQAREVAASLASDFGLKKDAVTVAIDGTPLAHVALGDEIAAIDAASAAQADLRAGMLNGLWKLALLIGAATFVLLVWAFGSVVLPMVAMLMTLLTVGAASGVLALVSKLGLADRVLGVELTSVAGTNAAILALAMVFGLTAGHMVFLLSRVRERCDAGDDVETAMATGVQRTGPIIASATVRIVVVVLAVWLSDSFAVRLIGAALAVAILVEATALRALLVPATVRLLGRRAWWAPRPMATWWQRRVVG